MVRPTPAPVSAPILPGGRRANRERLAVDELLQPRCGRVDATDSKAFRIRGSRKEYSLHYTATENRVRTRKLEGFAWSVYVLLSKVDGPCGRCMVWAMVFTKVVDGNQNVACDALLLEGQPHVPSLSIWATMIPRYSFPAAQQAQISEHLLAHSTDP